MDKTQSSQSSFAIKWNIKMTEGMQDDKSNEVFKLDDDREMKEKKDVTGCISDPCISTINIKKSGLLPVHSETQFTFEKNKFRKEENYRYIVPNLVVTSSRKMVSATAPSSFPRESVADSSDLPNNLTAKVMSMEFSEFRPVDEQNNVATSCGEATDENFHCESLIPPSKCTVIRDNQSHPGSIPTLVYDHMNGSDHSENPVNSRQKWIGQPCKNKTLKALNKKISQIDFEHKAMKTETNIRNATIQNLPDFEKIGEIPVCEPNVQQTVHRKRKLTNPHYTTERGKVTKFDHSNK